MSWDTKYRPKTYADVVGHENVISILMNCVSSRKGFEQSYVFGGTHGGGKTTLARILARALLCQEPHNGGPCDQCNSCRSLLETGGSENFLEIDAATHSGKDDVARIIEQISYSTFSGKRRIYLLDEAHRLSKEAFDALLKPMEDTVPGSSDKRLTCIFATTEPSRMRKTILSRCAPLFFLPHLSSEIIAQRLAYICEQEYVNFEFDALVTISELKENHIRDSIKTLEMLSMIGDITVDLVHEQFHFNLNELYLQILENITGDVKAALDSAKKLFMYHSPSEVYTKLAEISWLCFSVGNGLVESGSVWKESRLKNLYSKLGDQLIRYSEFFSSRPFQLTMSMLYCDLMLLSGSLVSKKISCFFDSSFDSVPTQERNSSREESIEEIPEEEEEFIPKVGGAPVRDFLVQESENRNGKKQSKDGRVVSDKQRTLKSKGTTLNGVYVDPRSVKKLPDLEGEERDLSSPVETPSISEKEFLDLLFEKVFEEKN